MPSPTPRVPAPPLCSPSTATTLSRRGLGGASVTTVAVSISVSFSPVRRRSGETHGRARPGDRPPMNPGERPRTTRTTPPTQLESVLGATPHEFESRILRQCLTGHDVEGPHRLRWGPSTLCGLSYAGRSAAGFLGQAEKGTFTGRLADVTVSSSPAASPPTSTADTQLRRRTDGSKSANTGRTALTF
jgi:hypothetical protein